MLESVLWTSALVTKLIHSFPMHPFSVPWKYQKTLRFSDVFRGQRKGALGTNGLNMVNFIKLNTFIE